MTASLPSLDGLDREIIFALDRDPTASFGQIAESVGTSSHTVSRRYRRLHSTGVIRIIGRTVPNFAGRSVWLARLRAHPQRIVALGKSLAVEPASRWVRASLDRTELMCGLITAGGHDEALDRVVTSVPISEVHTHQLLHVWSEAEATATPPHRLDEIDRRMLQVLVRDGRLDNRELASHLGVDASTASRRRRRLMDKGVLYFEADIHPGALGNAHDAMVWLQVRPGKIRDLGTHLNADSRVRFVAATAGQCQLVANVVDRDVVTFVDALGDSGVVGADVVPMGTVFKRNFEVAARRSGM